MYVINSSRRLPIFDETQINQSDKHDLEKVLEILNAISDRTIVWIVSGFHEGHLERVKTYMRSQKHKYIDFYALSVDEEAVVKLEELNKLYKLDVWDELQCIGDSACSPLELIDVYSQIPSTHSG